MIWLFPYGNSCPSVIETILKVLASFLLSFCNSSSWMLNLNFFTIIAHHFLSLCTFGVFNQISNTSVEFSVSLIICSISKSSCFQENPNLFYECNIIFCVSEDANCKFLKLSSPYLPCFLQTFFVCLPTLTSFSHVESMVILGCPFLRMTKMFCYARVSLNALTPHGMVCLLV